MAKKKVAQIIVETLELFGVKRCYGVVGDTLNDVTNAMRFHTEIEWVHVRHEEVGGFAAGAESFMTKGLTACAGSCGPGSLHFINGLYESHRNGAPVVLIASQLPTAVLGTNFPQEVDYKPIYEGCSVYCEEVKNPHEAKRVIMTACQEALAKRGVAVVILPSDISATEVEDLPIRQLYQPKHPLIYPQESELVKLAKIINSGGKVGIYAGAGCEGAHEIVIALAERLKAPIAHTSRGKDFIEGENPYNVGMTGMMGIRSGYQMIEECDTLIILGADFAWSQFYPKHAKIVQIDRDPQKLGLRHGIELGLIGDIEPTLERLLPHLDQRESTEFLDRCRHLYQKTVKKLDKKAVAASEELIHPQYLTELLSEYAKKDAFATADGGSATVWLLRHFETLGTRRTLVSLKHGTMANAMPQAIGIQKSHPDRQVIALCGDGGMTMLMGDLLTIVQEKLPVKIVVINNGTLDFVELEMKADGMVNSYTDLQNPDFALMADSIGMKGFSAKGSHELEETVKAFLEHEGPALLDVHTSRLELIYPPHATPGNYLNMALYGAKAIIGGEGESFFGMLKDNYLRK
ncbi:thiamine pyrophosphate-dependent enzyme [Ignatzschineria cameli]|uniref:Ubiquinone-dependent pyruvate dehydrogenase n=1 Tax=Ignatzschineria cameli TaxID=2182793 RepID=A0A2U2APT7_9GAMM|nr:thiamine pyrophosphate-dependent enzyme [Ignatzschineria cameli]PWD85533.1 ubiquinone-dependent pyruvate dehydrogenase [Ignatzschineria cameli]PWD89154.1 ubiquinone-dependent pyruvate dehydrogenase [Ignatzschineria cameli]PWD90673.1 ubiquinone-dependent pyruvate dehydrogenase [Ignatzschineria cameli]PWD91376.1 ubiquinone-dependent pyruvate dehydrogenase [Ignatzschineria cameli]